MVNSHIDDALVEIGKEYRRGLLVWLKSQPDRWRELLVLEERINEVVLCNQDETTLKDALSDYREFFEGMVEAYGNLLRP